MEFDPELWLRIKDKRLTAHQMQILAELAHTHSQTQAAANLGISVPVLHRHLKSLTAKLALELVTTTPNGTWLTNAGRGILRIYNRYQEMLKPEESIKLCCTPITHELLLDTISIFEAEGKKYIVSVNDDVQNLKELYLGHADLVLFDDPNFAIEFEDSPEEKILIVDIFQDTLVHANHGRKYIKYKYGAQRLGFRYLDAENTKYSILYETSSLNHILNQDKSYFINQSILKRNNSEISSDIDLNMFVHPILAVSINPTGETRVLVSAIRKHAESFFN
jgi:molybdenum-dependent DNA-binding transcriptional regulator ModE